MQNRLGRKERYGTQIVNDMQGRHLVFSLKDRGKADKWRAELVLKTRAKSLETQERWAGGKIAIQEGF